MIKLRGQQVSNLAFATILISSILFAVQNAAPPAQAPTPRPQFFAGSVIELDATHIKVTRTLVGRPTENRNFAITSSTKMNKSAIKLHSRVTVRFRRQPEGDVALEIQPRPTTPRLPKL